MTQGKWMIATLLCGSALSTGARADEFQLLTGVDEGLYPGSGRFVSPSGAGFPGEFFDGDRLAGTDNVGPAVPIVGTGDPLLDPNEFGALSLMFRRGTVPIGGGMVVPLMAIDFLGGPLLDLDGDLDNDARSLVPVFDQSAVIIPNSVSHIDLSFDFALGQVMLDNLDVTGTNEGAPNLPAEISVVLGTLAGTLPDGSQTGAINPGVDTRIGTLSAFSGNSDLLTTVFRIEDLGFEIWQDSTWSDSATADTLGSFQYLGSLNGWLVLRDPQTGQLPVLGGEGLGSTPWPLVDMSQIGNTFNTANGLAGGSATITSGPSGDDYAALGNGGVALADFGGDLGAYLDAVVIPLVDSEAGGFVYLESAGFGINNSADPIYTDTVAYDLVLIAQQCKTGDPDLNGSGTVGAADLAQLLGHWGPCVEQCCPADLNGDGSVGAADLAQLLGNWG